MAFGLKMVFINPKLYWLTSISWNPTMFKKLCFMINGVLLFMKNNAVVNNKTWYLVPLPPNRSIIGCKWVFKPKKNPDGSISRLWKKNSTSKLLKEFWVSKRDFTLWCASQTISTQIISGLLRRRLGKWSWWSKKYDRVLHFLGLQYCGMIF